MTKTETLSDRPNKISEDSNMLLEFSHDKLCRSNIYDMYDMVCDSNGSYSCCWTEKTSNWSPTKKILSKHQIHMTRRARLIIPEIERQRCVDRCLYTSAKKGQLLELLRTQTMLPSLSKRQTSNSASMTIILRSSE